MKEECTLTPIYKNKGDIQNYKNYQMIKLMSHIMKLLKRVNQYKLRKKTHISKNQFDFIPRRSTMDAIYFLWGLMKRYKSKERFAYDNSLSWKKLIIKC